MKLNPKAFALASGITWGLTVFLATLWVVVKGSGEHLQLLSRFYPGYSVSCKGSLIGLIYGLIDGGIFGLVFAWIYNKFNEENNQ